jgi:8-oxo-dGTP pyrophosphatase MutT (NUDIX family)
VSASQSSVERRLRAALSNTHERHPRPLVDLDLPFGGDRWLTPTFMKALRPAAVLAPVLRRGSDYSVMLTRRAEHLSSHRGQISFPGGRRDEGDVSAAANALREAQEEVGLDPARVEVLGYLDDYPTISRYLVTPVVGLIDGDFTPVADPGEVAEVFELPLEVALDPKVYQRRTLSREGLIVPFHELTWNGYRVWGATAGMLWDLCQKVVRGA